MAFQIGDTSWCKVYNPHSEYADGTNTLRYDIHLLGFQEQPQRKMASQQSLQAAVSEMQNPEMETRKVFGNGIYRFQKTSDVRRVYV